MGAGKTTVAQLLGEARAVATVDLDSLIETRAGSSISAIFARHGEDEFRRLELAAARDVLADRGDFVLALGGGAWMNPAIREACRDAGANVVYLHVSPEIAAARLDGPDQRAMRPLLVDDPGAALAALYDARDPTYRTADVVVDTDHERPDAIAARLAALGGRDG